MGVYARGGNGFVFGFVALAPWLLALDATPTLAGAARSGWLMSVAFVTAVFAWFGVAIGAFTGVGAATGLIALLLAAPLLQAQFIVFALVRQLAGRRHGPAVRALAGASAWVATEWLAPKLLGDTLGHGLYPAPLLRQAADVGGAAGLSFLLILVNEGVALAITRRRDGVRALAAPLALAAAILLLMGGYGFARQQWLAATQASDTAPLRVGLVQSNIYDYERLRRELGAYEVVRQVLDTHFALSREAIEKHQVDALLWSETVYPTTFAHPKSEDGAALDREILDFVDAAGVPLVFGSYDVDAGGEYNAAVFVEPGAGTLGFYRKANPFPFTERVPDWLEGPTLRRWLPWAGTWKAGDGARLFPLRLADGREIPVLPLICLDDVDTGLAIDGARLGAQAILTMSNDSWFTAHPVGANLHLAVAAFRSIETNLPQLRVTANGVSAVIDATGAVLAATAIGERKLLVGEVSAVQPRATLMVAWGDWVGRAGLAFLVLLAGLAAVAAWQRRRARATPGAPAIEAEFRDDGAVLPPAWRIAALTLRLIAGAGLLWVGATMLSGDPAQTNPLRLMEMFAALVLAPELAAWSIRRAFHASLRSENHRLLLDLGQPVYARIRAAVARRWFDHPLVKFVLFPLLPALPAFRLHQHIAFGGTFGEYYTYGLKAYLLAFGIWWASWAIGLVLFAAVLRVMIEAGTVLAIAMHPERAPGVRVGLEGAGRLLFYVGVPLWFGLRVWPW